ncbi:MAG: hypothetical protein KBD27_00880 [Candidatus Moranbacteria bacterium]|nr:hypothetical protein [Candidatus Moranbacteria bacterium]
MLSVARNKKTKKISYIAFGLIFILVVGFALPQPVQAGFWSCATDPIFCVVNGVLYGIFVVVGALVSAAVGIFEYAVNPDVFYGPNGLFNKESVYNMWKFVRDFFNLFFILTLLYTAFTIVFQIAGNYKKTLLSIVLAALFVNFSFPLTRVMIDATNVPMYYFANLIMSSKGGDATTTASGALGPALSASGLKELLISEESEITDLKTSQILMAIIFLFVFMVTLMVLAILFVVRVMVLLVLVMFSAVGFAGSVIPGMKKYSDMWWDKLAQYALFGPAAMLMLYMATQLFSEISKDNTKHALKLDMAANATAQSSSFLASVGMYSITIIMMWIAIGLANSMSIAGAGMVTGKGQQFLKWAGRKSTVSPAMWAGRKVDSKLAGSKNLSFLSPGAWRMALKQRGEEQKHKDEQPIKQAAARRQDWLNDKVSRVTQAGSTMLEGGIVAWPGAVKTMFKEKGKDHTDHNFAQTQAQAGEYRKEISDVSTQSDYVINEMRAALATGNTAKADASLQILAKNNDLNDMLTGLSAADVDRYGIRDKKDENGNIIEKRVDEKGRAIVSSENMLLALQGIMRDSGETNAELLAKKLMVISDDATGAGNYAFGGMTKFDQDMNDGHGGFRVARRKGEKYIDKAGREQIQTTDEQAEWASAKVKNIESQERQRKIHPDSMFTRTAEGGFGDINGEVAKEIIKTFTQGDVKNVERSRDDMKAAIYNAFTHMNDLEKDANGNMVPTSKYAGFRAAYNDKSSPIFKDYVDAVKVTKEKKQDDKDKKGGGATSTGAPTGGGAAPAPVAPNWTTSPGASGGTP